MTENKNQLISMGEGLKLSLNDLSNPESLEKVLLKIKKFWGSKKKIGLPELLIILEQNYSKEEIAEKITNAILIADNSKALSIWSMCSSEIQYSIIIPDKAKVDLDIVVKLDLNGSMVRKAFMKHINFLVPKRNEFSVIYGEYTSEYAEELVVILEDMWNSKPDGKILIQEFFHQIDFRVLYLICIKEIEQFKSDDPHGGAHIHVALRTNDQVPEGLALLTWLQLRVPLVFYELSEDLLNPIFPENRALFWETFLKMNHSHLGSNHFEECISGNSLDAEAWENHNDDLLKKTEM